MLRVGDRAPEFTLPDQDGRDVSLSSLIGKRRLVLYFYPADFTPGCTREACSLRDVHAELDRAGLAVAGVSPQGPESHRKFREKHHLPFALLADTDKSVAKMYGVVGPLGIGVRRATFLIDQGRTIRACVLADFRIAKHEQFVADLLALNSVAK
ncbi:MAG TPA: peroxiredoxin [Steroidobacteraceae bacterium]|nr:peroxiredoxin [Steroidobacteraceae bacterium]